MIAAISVHECRPSVEADCMGFGVELVEKSTCIMKTTGFLPFTVHVLVLQVSRTEIDEKCVTSKPIVKYYAAGIGALQSNNQRTNREPKQNVVSLNWPSDALAFWGAHCWHTFSPTLVFVFNFLLHKRVATDVTLAQVLPIFVLIRGALLV